MGRFRLDIRGNFFIGRVIRCWSGWPGRYLVESLSSGCVRKDWTWHLVPRSIDVVVVGLWVWLHLTCLFQPSWFCDSVWRFLFIHTLWRYCLHLSPSSMFFPNLFQTVNFLYFTTMSLTLYWKCDKCSSLWFYLNAFYVPCIQLGFSLPEGNSFIDRKLFHKVLLVSLYLEFSVTLVLLVKVLHSDDKILVTRKQVISGCQSCQKSSCD